MDRIGELLADPAWWFTAVFVTVLASILGAFAKDAILNAIARVSSRASQKKAARDRTHEQEVCLLLADTKLLHLAFQRATLQSVQILTLLLAFLLLSVLNALSPEGTSTYLRLAFSLGSTVAGIESSIALWNQRPAIRAVNTAYRRYRSSIERDVSVDDGSA